MWKLRITAHMGRLHSLGSRSGAGSRPWRSRLKNSSSNNKGGLTWRTMRRIWREGRVAQKRIGIPRWTQALSCSRTLIGARRRSISSIKYRAHRSQGHHLRRCLGFNGHILKINWVILEDRRHYISSTDADRGRKSFSRRNTTPGA